MLLYIKYTTYSKRPVRFRETLPVSSSRNLSLNLSIQYLCFPSAATHYFCKGKQRLFFISLTAACADWTLFLFFSFVRPDLSPSIGLGQHEARVLTLRHRTVLITQPNQAYISYLTTLTKIERPKGIIKQKNKNFCT